MFLYIGVCMKRVLAKDSRKIGPWYTVRGLKSIFGMARSAVSSAKREPFDAAFYLKNNPDVAAAGIDPYEHYIHYGREEGRHGVPFSPSPSIRKQLEESDEPFDAEFYLDCYPDVASSGADPLEHYLLFGRHEGRTGARPNLKYVGTFDDLDSSRETVLVVSHEASRTGAPVLSLNIVRELKKKYNVVSMLLAEGALFADFQHASDVVIKPVSSKYGATAYTRIIDQLLDRQKFDFALVNSIESRKVLPGLAKHFVPAITLIHEFAAYTRPREAFREVARWSSDTVFSAPVIYQDALAACPDVSDSVHHVFPQGRCSPVTLPADDGDHSVEDARITQALRPQEAPANTIVVLGAGSVQLRKGVDLFLECAARVLRASPSRPFRFVWVGKGYDPERDMDYSAYLADQVSRAGLQDHVSFVGETASIEAAYAAADLMLISSRLDPLPNVAIDAMAHGLPVLCFDRTTGIADVLKANGLGDECVAAYLDAVDMAQKTLRFIHSDALRREVGEKSRSIVTEQFDMAGYVAKLEALATGARYRMVREQADIETISLSTLPSLQYMVPFHLRGMSREQGIHEYVGAWASGIYLRKPFPGFHPGIYLERSVRREGDPLANYLSAGQPAGPWRYEVIEPTESELVSPLPKNVRVALHVHVYYPDLLQELLGRLALNAVLPDLFVSVPNRGVEAETRSLLESYQGRVVDVAVVPNRGRDIGPFLTAFGKTLLENYDLVGHLHTKKTKDVVDATMVDVWRSFLLENMLGGQNRMADIILGRMMADPSIGMVFPDDPNAVRWDKNKPYAEKLAERLGLSELPEHFLFPVGSMFWARVEALRPCFELDLQWMDYPSEPLPYDGSMLHALERLFGVCAARAPFRLVATHVPGFVR